MIPPESWPAADLWQHADSLVTGGRIVVDRPAGSVHPMVGTFVYPLDYGYVADTVGGDGESVDVWIGSGPDELVTAVACTIDPYKKNAEVKLLWRCTPDEVALVEAFYAPQPQGGVDRAPPDLRRLPRAHARHRSGARIPSRVSRDTSA